MKRMILATAAVAAVVTVATVAKVATARAQWGTGAAPPAADAEYLATLTPLNSAVSKVHVNATMRFLVRGDSVTILVHTAGLPASIEHWQHFHGFVEGKQAACPTAASDKNGDGLVDIRETEPAAGTTMVPFNVDPVAMVIPTNTYPHADATGAYDYAKTVSLSKLNAAFGSHFGGHTIDLNRRVVLIHGIPQTAPLAASAASLGDIPARTTLPLACGVIKRLR
jgi:hypothetical protein